MPTYPGYGINFPYVWDNDVRGSGAAFPVIGFVLVMLRLNARRWQRARIGVDDILAVLALICLIGMGTCFIYGANHKALGWPTPPEDGNNNEAIKNHNYRSSQLRILQHLQYTFQIFMILTYGLTKLSIVWFCRRLFIPHKRTTLDYVTSAITALISLWTIAYFFAYLFYCKTHPSAFWSSPLEELKYCLNIASSGRELQYSMIISDLFLDVICVALPFPLIWRLQLTLPQKLSITGIFLIGLMTVAASIARIVVYFQVDATSENPQEDIFLAITLTLYWSMLEAGLAFIASQLPALSQYLTKFSGINLLGSLRNVVSWISLQSTSSRDRVNVISQDRPFHELHDSNGGLHKNSEATTRSATSDGQGLKSKSSDAPFLPNPPNLVHVRRDISVEGGDPSQVKLDAVYGREVV